MVLSRSHNAAERTLTEGCWCEPYAVPTPTPLGLALVFYHRDEIARAIDHVDPRHGIGPYHVLWSKDSETA